MIHIHLFSCSHVIFTMIKIYAYTCLLSALSIVEMKPLYINRRVGESVTITCSDWNIWTSVKKNVKYFCDSPCTEDHHIIIKAAYGDTTYKNRLKLYNKGEGLFVTFTNLQKSDSKTYYCGLERSGRDSFIKVILNVIDAHPPSPKTTPKTIIVGSTPSFAVTYNSTMSSNVSDIITEMSTSYTTLNTTTSTASATQGSDRSVPYLVIGVIAIITILMVLLKLMSKMMKQQLNVVSSADPRHEDVQEEAEYEEIRPEDQTDSNILDANYSHHQVAELAAERGNSYSKVFYLNLAPSFVGNSRGAFIESRVTNDSLYSVAQLPKEEIEPTGQCEPTQSESNENDSLYSLAQLPQAATVVKMDKKELS
ncbi:uncharacterized protein [Cebidichthys violaceus]|uniref:uncharacterized protein n=1 Tax=Cebidichthys violaceus TaxID=271503 RepID=UPI0035C95FEE